MNRRERKKLREAYLIIREFLPMYFEDFGCNGICAVMLILRYNDCLSDEEVALVEADIKRKAPYRKDPYNWTPAQQKPRLEFMDKRINKLSFWGWLRRRG